MKQTMIEPHRVNRILASIPLSRSPWAVIPLIAMRPITLENHIKSARGLQMKVALIQPPNELVILL